MDDDIARVDQDPVSGGQPLYPNRTARLGFELARQLFGHGGDLTGRPATGDHHMIGNRGFPGERDGDHLHRLIIVKRLENHLVQGFNGVWGRSGLFGRRGQFGSQYIMRRDTASRTGVGVKDRCQSGLARLMAVAELVSGGKRNSTRAGGLHCVQ